MSDDFGPILEAAIRQTGIERYRFLCSDANDLPPPNSREAYRRLGREIADPYGVGYPPLAQQASNLAASLWDWAVSGFTMATAREMANRLRICHGCPEYVADEQRCRLCGCYLLAKIRLKPEKCPIDKW